MQVGTIETSAGQTRYYLSKDDGTPIEPVRQYLKFRDNGGAARNTLRLTCIFMKHYFTYLEKRGLRWQAVTIDDLADFLAWLKYPRIDEKVIPLNLEPKYRAETINAILDTVLAFYHYQYLRGGLDNTVSEKLVTFIKNPHGAYRSFLDGIADRRREKRYLLRLPTPKRVLRTVTKEEVEAVMKACVNVRDYFLMYLLFETGMRIGELIGLRWSDIDFKNRTMKIERSMEYRYKVGEWRVGPPKSKSGYRTIPLKDEAIRILENQKLKNRSLKLVPIEWKDTVFLCRKGTPVKNSTYDTGLFKYCDRIGIPRFSMHVLRHTFATRCIEGGMKPKTLQKILGHSNIGITMNLYVHITEDEKHREIDLVADALKVI